MLLSFVNATLTIQFSYVVMSKGKEKVSSKQFRWLPAMHEIMLRILAQEAQAISPQALSRQGPLHLLQRR